MNKKEGLATKEEIKILWKLASGELGIPKVLKPVLDMALPSILDGLENKVSEKIPEPWQSHCENVVTMVVAAVEDKKVTEEEAEEMATYLATVIDEKIDIPLVEDEVEAAIFLQLFKLISMALYSVINKKKVQ